MSTHEIVTAPLGLMNPYNCCTNILNLIACNVVNTQLSAPIRRAAAWVIQNSGKPKIIYMGLWGSMLDSGLQTHLSNYILFSASRKISVHLIKPRTGGRGKLLKCILGVGRSWH